LTGRLAAAVTGRRGRWLTVAVWVLLGAAGLLARAHIDDVTAAGQSSFLPTNAESTRAVDALQRGYNGGEDVPVVLVFERRGGLTEADLNAIGGIGRGLERLRLTGATPIVDPFSAQAREPLGDVARIAHGVGPISRDGEAALVVLAIDAGERNAIVSGVERIRAYLGEHRRPGLAAYVTGPGGIAADLEQVAGEAGQTLLFATLGLVLVLLLVVYRAPLLALLPLLAVGAAYLVASGIAYLLIESGLIAVNTEGTLLLLVLIFGAGTDYSLLLVHRYREELESGGAPAAALPAALRESVPAIAASGGTVIAAMLVLLVADLQSTHWLGPILAVGIAVMLAAAFTLLPALLSLLGERAFWPTATSPSSLRGFISTSAAQKEARSFWERIAALVRRRSRPIVVAVFALLAVLALGNLTEHETIGFGQGETKPTNSSRGTEALEAHFPAGLGSPLTAVVAADRVAAVTAAMERLPEVELALPVPAAGSAELAIVVLVLDGDPYSSEAASTVDDIRERLHAVDPGGLLGGVPAENFDIEATNHRDTKLIVPLVLLVVGLILAALLGGGGGGGLPPPPPRAAAFRAAQDCPHGTARSSHGSVLRRSPRRQSRGRRGGRPTPTRRRDAADREGCRLLGDGFPGRRRRRGVGGALLESRGRGAVLRPCDHRRRGRDPPPVRRGGTAHRHARRAGAGRGRGDRRRSLGDPDLRRAARHGHRSRRPRTRSGAAPARGRRPRSGAAPEGRLRGRQPSGDRTREA
jgi:putative drug exporter of the RND superfamily